MNCTIKSLLIPGLILFAACGGNTDNSTTDSSTMATKTDTTSKMVQNNSVAEQTFIDYAVPANTKEIIWLEAGIHKGHNKELKQHADMMLTDHKKLDAAVKQYLDNHRNLNAPTVDTTNVVDINDKKGAEWDKAWTNKMVDDHSDLLSKLQNSQKDVKDTALLSLINSTVPVVESHLAMAKTLKTKIK